MQCLFFENSIQITRRDRIITCLCTMQLRISGQESLQIAPMGVVMQGLSTNFSTACLFCSLSLSSHLHSVTLRLLTTETVMRAKALSLRVTKGDLLVKCRVAKFPIPHPIHLMPNAGSVCRCLLGISTERQKRQKFKNAMQAIKLFWPHVASS